MFNLVIIYVPSCMLCNGYFSPYFPNISFLWMSMCKAACFAMDIVFYFPDISFVWLFTRKAACCAMDIVF